MGKRLEAYKPAAPARLHLLLAAAMWSVVGAALLVFGARWTITAEVSHAWLLLGIAAGVGALKARFVLDRTVAGMIERIRRRGDGRCIGGFLSVRSWAFVVLMVVTGRLLRGTLLSRALAGFIYTAVGVALLLAARRLWYAWYVHGCEE